MSSSAGPTREEEESERSFLVSPLRTHVAHWFNVEFITNEGGA